MERRTFLKVVSASTVAGMTALAGCSGGGNDAQTTTSGGQGAGTEQSTTQTTSSSVESTATVTTTATATSSATATSTAPASTSTNQTSATAAGSSSTTSTTSTANASTTGTEATSTGTTAGESTTGTTTVGMYTKSGDYYFDPIGLHVESGMTVTFEIKAGAHSSTAYEKGNGPATVTRIPDGAKAWNSEILNGGGKTFDHTFETEGTYDRYFPTEFSPHHLSPSNRHYSYDFFTVH